MQKKPTATLRGLGPRARTAGNLLLISSTGGLQPKSQGSQANIFACASLSLSLLGGIGLRFLAISLAQLLGCLCRARWTQKDLFSPAVP